MPFKDLPGPKDLYFRVTHSSLSFSAKKFLCMEHKYEVQLQWHY